MNFRNRLVVLIVVLSMVSCASYERSPLALHAYLDDWTRRELDVQAIHDFAAHLAGPQAPPAAFDSQDGLSLSEALAVALHFNPELRRTRAQSQVPLAAAEQAGWWPDPQFEAEVLRFVNRGRNDHFRFDGPSFDGVNTGLIGPGGPSIDGIEFTRAGYRRVQGDFVDDPWIVGASLSVTIPVSGRIAVEKELNWAQYSAAWRRILVAEWELITRLRDAWFEWSIFQQRLTVTRNHLQSLTSIAEIAEQLAQAGEMTPTEARVLRIELARRQTTLQTLESEAERRRLIVFAMLGVKPSAPVNLQPEVLVLPVPTSDQDPDHRLLENHPRLRAARADYEVAEQQLRLEIRKQYPDLQIGPSYSFEEGFSRLGLGFGLPIPLWNRNRQGVAEAQAAREFARVRAEAEVELIISELAQVQTQLDFAGRRRAHLLEQVAPLVDKQVQDSRALLNLGEVDVLLLRDALTGSFETKLQVLDVTLAEARAANQLVQMLQPQWFTPSQAIDNEVPQ